MSLLRHFRSTISSLCTKHALHRCAVSRPLSTTTHVNNSTEEEDETLLENPFYSKYEDKIKKLKESGVYEPPKDQYNKALQRETAEWKQKIQKLEKKLTEKRVEENKIAGLKLPAKLDQLMRTDLLSDVSAEDVGKLWTKYWSDRETVSAIIATDVFDAMTPRMKEFPVFLYPLPRDQGYEFFMSQFTEHHCFLTSLLNYQMNGEDAPWQVCFKMYPELRESHGVVLMACEFDGNVLSVMEAQFLAQLQQLFYANPTEGRVGLLRNFNHFPDSFKHMDVVKEIESGGLVIKS
jgi:ATP synthase F1 complex assembly factor 1